MIVQEPNHSPFPRHRALRLLRECVRGDFNRFYMKAEPIPGKFEDGRFLNNYSDTLHALGSF